MHETPTIKAQVRDRIGSRYAKRLRSQGRLPAVIYGHKIDPVHISVDEKEVLIHLRHGSHVVAVDLEGKSETCLVKDLQFGYLGDDVIHLDLARVNLDEEVTVHVGLHFVGESSATKAAGAIVSHPLTELEITCKVSDIPEEIKVDLNRMDGDVLTVGQIDLPPGVRTDLEPGTPVVVVAHVHAEPVAGEAVEITEEAAEPEVIAGPKPEAEEEA
jgi:large subunit ribosomal protein L25